MTAHLSDESYLRILLDTPGESARADYKSAVEFRENEAFSFQLTKQIIGFANNDGGYIVIGFNDADLSIDKNLSGKIVASYDTTRLSQFVGSCISNHSKITITVHKINKGNTTFPIVAVEAFKEHPFFTSDKAERKNFAQILRSHCIYFRDEEAKTVEIANEAQFKRILDRSVKLRQNDMLKSFTDLLQMATGRPLASSTAHTATDFEWIREARLRAVEGLEINEKS